MFRVAKIQLPLAKTVRQYLFEGYNDPLLDLLNKLNSSEFNIPFDKFGWFYDVNDGCLRSVDSVFMLFILQRNNSWSYDGKFDMYTGHDNLSKLGILTEWNDTNHTKYNYGACSMVNGTTGELWPPVNGTADLDLFATDLCR
jgi:scavenger receptor class B, member 1